ncbi:hypothetical protein OAU68_02705, partial [Litorivicinus sp.]|nr:hypothetical protein [Litorivicinus sp.]
IFDTSGNNLQAIWKAQRASWNAMGTDGQKAYKDMQSVYRASYNRLKDVIFGQIDNLVGDKNSANKLKKDIFSRMFKQSTLDVYFPLMREGDYVLRFNAKNPKSEREKTTLITYTTKLLACGIANGLASRNSCSYIRSFAAYSNFAV